MLKYNKNKKYKPLELMELAYQESLNSISEHDDKPDPLVGAILTTSDGKILATAHRGELRVGEHCEYTLIERKLKSENLSGCHLYVTLEPCVDAVRNIPKRGCATHIQKARIGKVFVGMRDPDIDIENEGVKELLKNSIEVEDFPSEIAAKIRLSLKEFIEFKEVEKLIKKEERKVEKVPFLKQASINSSITQFSVSAVNKFIEHSNAKFTFPSDEFINWALSFELATKSERGIEPTKLGMLVFGEKKEDVHANAHSIFKVEIDYGGTTEIMDFDGPITIQLPAVLDFVKNKGLKLTIDRTDAKRKVNEDFPFEILREVIANAIIHRDYSIEESTNYVYINSEKIIIRSPGLPVAPLTIDDIKTMDLPSISRNPKIMYVFNRMGMAEQRGIGLRSLKRLPKLGFPLPQFKLKGKILEIVFGRDSSLIAEMRGFDNLDITTEDREGLYFIQQNNSVTVNDYASHFGLTNKTAQRRLADLVEKDLLVKEGKNRWTKYQLRNNEQ